MKYELTFGLTRGKAFSGGSAAINENLAVSILARTLGACGIDAATFIPCVGVWRGEVESSVRVEVWADDNAIGQGSEAIADFTLRACVELQQDCALVAIGQRSTLVGHSDRLIEVERRIAALDVRSEAS